ncbi:hypothetical protein C8J57DRAFT_1605677 [Mycena rebaudengoi]|nr:hypothetical protein C8J57DRAFT_1605677 [Mycena rebaudengoi]
MFSLSGIARHRQNGAWTEPRILDKDILAQMVEVYWRAAVFGLGSGCTETKGALIVEPNTLPPLPILSARDDYPLRWGSLDPDYLTTSSRNIFYGPDPATFSPRMLRFDNFTKDVGSIASLLQVPISTLITQYTGCVAKVVGSEDQLLCPGTRCEDVAALNAAEKVLWPDAKSFEVLVAQGSGHDLNLDFLAEGPFNTFVRLVEQFST